MYKLSFILCMSVCVSLLLVGCDQYEVKEIPKSIYLDKESISLFVDDQLQLKASPTDGIYQFQWSVEDPSVATVSSNGLLKAIAPGITNVIVKGGSVQAVVPLITIVRVPLQDVILSETFIELFPGTQKKLSLTYEPTSANDIPKGQWSTKNSDIATVNEIGEVTAIREGSTMIVFRTGNIERTVHVEVSNTKPFNGPHIISSAAGLIVYAVDFDYGGEGYAFHDSDPENPIGNDDYRRSKGDTQGFPVEIEGDGSNIGFSKANEWLLYTVDVVDAGEYLVDIGLSAAAETGKFHLEVDGVNVTGTIKVPNNGSWSDWRLFPSTPLIINLTKERHRIKFFFEEEGFNFKGIRFVKK
ncbi:Ig-like domain (group 2) [bacterium A37T11]|nr:Ig-like domain (group 2) [bacterium A37T11]